ncbi:hypothetical protein [Providencia sp.]|uniref:hypothetical protein n=1 Tax=Providencia sp. TaxID=589 RepID=UPI003F958098
MSNNTIYSASRIFTENDLITTKKLLRENKSSKEMYQYLANKGDRYALFAGVSGSDTNFWGRSTLYFSFNSDFISDEKFRDDKYKEIDFKLASEYLILLENKLNNSGGKFVELTEINYEELFEINQKSCSDSWFSIDDWYLNRVFESLSPNERQGLWEHRLNSTSGFKEQVSHHYKIYNMMIKKYILSNGHGKERIKVWLNNNFYITQYGGLINSNIDNYIDIISSDSELKDLIDSVNKSIKIEEEVLGDTIPWTFHYVISDNLLTQDAITLMKNENVLFWEDKEEKLKSIMNEISVNRYNRRKKRAALLDANDQDKFELHLKDVQKMGEKLEEKKDPQILYNYLEANNEEYGVIPNGLVRGDSSAGKMATSFLVERAKQYNIILNHNDLKRIQFKVALETRQKLLDKFDNEKTTVLREKFTIRDIEDIHDNVFISENLPKDAWTLSIPLQIIPIEKHNEIYDEMISNSGSNKQQVEFGLYLTDEMMTEIIKNPSKEKFNLFVEWANTVSTVDNMKETGSVFGEYLVERGMTFKEFIAANVNELKKVIPKSDLDIYGVERKILPTETQPINRGVSSPPPIKYPHNMVGKSILENTYPKAEPNRQLAPLTTGLLDRLKVNEKPVTTNHYLERPSVVLPGTPGFKDFPKETMKNTHHFENMVGQLSDNMSSMDPFDGSSNNYFSDRTALNIPSRFSSYSSNSFFS